MTFGLRNFGVIVGSAASLLALYACGGGEGSPTPPVSVTSNAYQGAGSAWSLASNSDGTCTLSESSSNLKVNATCAKLSSGFTKITVTSAEGGSASLTAPSAGTVTYAYEVDGYMMPFIAFTENKVVPTVSAGTCSSSLNHNFVVSFAKLGSNTDFTGWATMGNYTLTNGALALNRFKADGTSFSPENFPMSTSECSNGLLEKTTDGDLTRFYFTQNGGAIFYRDSSQSRPMTNGGSTGNNFMLPTTNDVASLAGLDGNYIGFVTTSTGNGTYSTTPVSVTATNGAFAMSARSGTDLTTSNANHSSFTLEATKVASSLYKGSLTHTNAGGSIGCAINANISNQKIVICSGLDPADTTNKTLYSAILKSI
jgi:hypothetical protein